MIYSIHRKRLNNIKAFHVFQCGIPSDVVLLRDLDSFKMEVSKINHQAP